MHYSEDELILYHYGEARRRERIDEHLNTCDACAAAYREIAGTLALVADVDVPERDDRYGLEVWQRIRHDLPVQEPPWWMAWYRPTLASGLALFITAAFVAGRYWPDGAPAAPVTQSDTTSPDAGARVLSLAIGDHLDESERVLLDFVNASGDRVDVSGQQAWAADLVDANRLYRDAAERAGDDTIAGVLDELERNLLEIVHGPSTMTPAEFETVRARLDAAALLFKVRVLSGELRERDLAPTEPRKTT
ncbi:MAG: hypothetical protein A3H97_00815 [Acidobacteria bacterium RIFCSPLOWO2_02_FULL_65_29]|nr:MAG: hypothetical protein A3H97_00815 [Acidobacteria bacterium RIFCSPLOWO2_02_FULL_65_29]